MNDHLQFQLANKSFFAELLSMMEAFYNIDGYRFQRQLAENNLHRFIVHQDLGRIWIIFAAGEIAGYVILTSCFSFEFGGRTAFIDELFLKPSYRNKGIGGKVIDFILQEAIKMDLKALHLEVEHHNEKGKKLYLKKQFKEHDRSLMTRMIE